MAFIIDIDGNLIGKLEDYESFAWSRQLFNHGAFELTINQNQFISDFIEEGNLILPDELGDIDIIYTIEKIENTVDQSGKAGELLQVSGRQFGGFFDNRIILPPENNPDYNNPPDGDFAFDNQSGDAETVMKHYVAFNGGDESTPPRAVENLVIAANQGRGDNVVYKGRFQTLVEALNKLGKDGNLGWENKYDIDLNQFTFDVIDSVDRSDNIVFNVDINTNLAQNFLTNIIGSRNFAYSGGEGEGVNRIIEEVYLADTEPSGFDRRESFNDAGNISEVDAIQSSGRIFLIERTREAAIEVEFNTTGRFTYRRDFDLGDIVNITNAKWDLNVDLKIVGATIEIDNAAGEPKINLQLGDLFPTIKTKSDLLYGEDERERV